MADITAGDIRKVREITGAGMSDVKKALVEADGDHAKAIEVLRLKGAKDVGKRESRTTSNGLVAVALEGASVGVLLELLCETDFVAKTPQFQELGATIAQHALTARIATTTELLSASFGTGTVSSALDDANVALGEKIEIQRVSLVEGAYLGSYLHKTSPDLPPAIGVLVALSGENAELGKQLAQHIAAHIPPPRYLTREEVPAEAVEAERRLAEQIAREEGKPEAAIAKITEGKVTGFYKDFVLLEQKSVHEGNKPINQVAADAGVEVTGFARYKVGQA